MRKISEDVRTAFRLGENFKSGNTQVISKDGDTMLLLHGNMIAHKSALAYTITTAGWNTVTTRERLNALPGVSVYQKNFELFLNDEPWDGELTMIRGMSC
jgi:hypothetical protein